MTQPNGCEQARREERKKISGGMLHYVISCRQETQMKIEEMSKHKGHPPINRWRKCVDKIIAGIKHFYGDEVELDEEFVCYHITTRDRLAEILKDGLKPNAEPNWFSSPTPYVMLSKYPYWQLYEDKDMVLLEIKHPNIIVEFFNDTEGLRWGEVIDPKFINMVVDFKVNKYWQTTKEKAKAKGDFGNDKVCAKLGTPNSHCL